jgi:hypothetical protein
MPWTFHGDVVRSLAASPFACAASSYCSPVALGLARFVVAPVTIGALGLLVARRWPVAAAGRAAALTVVAVSASLWTARVVSELVSGIVGKAGDEARELLRAYTQGGLDWLSGALFFILFAATLVLVATFVQAMTRDHVRSSLLAEVSAAAVLVAGFSTAATWHPGITSETAAAYLRNVKNAPLTSVGAIFEEDIRLARAAASLVPSSEKVLLPGVVKQMNEWELWYFAIGGSRALALYTAVPFAFFHQGSPYGRAAEEYRDHVCDRFDLPWLATRGVVWVYESARSIDTVCVRSWPQARAKYFDLALREGSAALWRLRTDRLGEAANDPLLGL